MWLSKITYTRIVRKISNKCIPVLIYGLEACPLLKSDILSLNFLYEIVQNK